MRAERTMLSDSGSGEPLCAGKEGDVGARGTTTGASWRQRTGAPGATCRRLRQRCSSACAEALDFGEVQIDGTVGFTSMRLEKGGRREVFEDGGAWR